MRPKLVASLQLLYCNKFTYFIWTWWLFFS